MNSGAIANLGIEFRHPKALQPKVETPNFL